MNEMTVPSLPPGIPVPPSVARVGFAGDRTEFRRLVTRGGLLEIVTAGFYRFWLATDMRRHLWSSTVVDGDAAEYTGRAKELLIGFLIALAVLIPLYVIYALLTLEAERYQAFAGTPLIVATYLFGQFAIYRARRYRLTRTVWRGVRFWMSGSGWAYAFRAFLWGMLVVFSLGLALPWSEAALERYKMRHSYYGDLQGSFEGRGWDFFKQAWWIWLLSPTALLIVPAPFLYAAFRAVQWRWWLSGIRFGEVRLHSNLENGALIGRYWSVIGWSLVISTVISIGFGLIVIMIAVIANAAGGEGIPTLESLSSVESGAARMVSVATAAISYLLYVVALNVVVRVYLTHDIWKIVSESIAIFNLDAASNVAAKGELANAIGEGFADGLDVAGF